MRPSRRSNRRGARSWGTDRRSKPIVPLRVDVGDVGAETGQRLRSEHGVDRRKRSFARALIPLRPFGAAAERPVAACGRDRESAGADGRLPELVAGAILSREPAPNAVEADLRRFAPAAEERQLAAALEQTRRDELDLGAFVSPVAV